MKNFEENCEILWIKDMRTEKNFEGNSEKIEAKRWKHLKIVKNVRLRKMLKKNCKEVEENCWKFWRNL